MTSRPGLARITKCCCYEWRARCAPYLPGSTWASCAVPTRPGLITLPPAFARQTRPRRPRLQKSGIPKIYFFAPPHSIVIVVSILNFRHLSHPRVPTPWPLLIPQSARRLLMLLATLMLTVRRNQHSQHVRTVAHRRRLSGVVTRWAMSSAMPAVSSSSCTAAHGRSR